MGPGQPGPAVEISTFGPVKTILCGGEFKGLIQIEINEFAGGAFAPIAQCDQPRDITDSNPRRFVAFEIRTNSPKGRSFSGVPAFAIGGGFDGETGPQGPVGPAGPSGVGLFAPPEKWGRVAIPANMPLTGLSALVSVNFDDIVMIRPGSIVGLNSRIDPLPVSAGTLTLQVMINGAGGALSVVSTSVSNASGGRSVQASGVDSYLAGDRLRVGFLTDAGFMPLTTNVESWIDCEAA